MIVLWVPLENLMKISMWYIVLLWHFLLDINKDMFLCYPDQFSLSALQSYLYVSKY